MKKSMVEKIEEAMRELEIARKWVFRLGEGEDDVLAGQLTRRERAVTLQSHGEKPLLVISRRPPAGDDDERVQRKRERDAEAYERRKARQKAAKAAKEEPRPRTGMHQSRAIALKLFLEGGRPMTSSDLMQRWPGGVLTTKLEKQKAYQAVHELKKLGMLRHNEAEGYYALSEAGARMARNGASPTV